ncbi:hypothetical protein NEPAR04_1110 [Nematocida parisii]|nr:hypothetical protein NEPAR08_0946 [Nematocida parisii]KAI5127851.1 hypothetical protein NEPAR03_1131 [Nematocida parisii]KAI5141633.1 hypothetical protein NEPAR04_1110 [Nematocida parisii]
MKEAQQKLAQTYLRALANKKFIMTVYSYAVLCRLFKEEETRVEKNEEEKFLLNHPHVKLICQSTLPTKQESKEETESIRTVVCTACSNGIAVIVKDKENYTILTDKMNTIPIYVHTHKKTGSVTVAIGQPDEKDEHTTVVLKYDEGICMSSNMAWIVRKTCTHQHACLTTSGVCIYINTDMYLEHILHNSLKEIISNNFHRRCNSIFISFSGGIDSFLCATLCCKYFSERTIYLINTSFYKNGKICSRDRQASIELYPYLLKYTTQEKCILVENNITREEIICNKDKISEITKNTTMDFNLAALHYFTAKKTKELGGTCIFTGTGGDELFLGYSRHRDKKQEIGDSILNISKQSSDVSYLEIVAGAPHCAKQMNSGVEQNVEDISSDVSLAQGSAVAVSQMNSGSVSKHLVSMIMSDVAGFWSTNLHRDYNAGLMSGVSPLSPFLCDSVLEYAVLNASPNQVEKKQLTKILEREHPGIRLKKKLAGQYGSGIADVIRSIRCRAHTLCRNNECLSLECTSRESKERPAE